MSHFFLSCSYKSNDNYKPVSIDELEVFMDNYGQMLKNRNLEKTVNLYYNDTIILSVNGHNKAMSPNSLKKYYLKQSRDTINFKWDNIKVNLLSKDKAYITSTFYWNNRNKPDTLKFSYTGIFIKTDTGWKIMHEHESFQCN